MATQTMDLNELHDQVSMRLIVAGQRYTQGRRQLIEALAKSERPMDMGSIMKETSALPLSSAYRTLSTFTSLVITQRIAGPDDNGHFELSEEFLGRHHHHAICQVCGKVADIDSSPKLERALREAAQAAGEKTGFVFDAHRIDLVGKCNDCVSSAVTSAQDA